MKRTKEQMKALVAEYGQVAIWIHVGVFFIVLTVFTVTIATGLDVDSASGSGGTLLAAYVATKATSPLRIAFTLATTPFIGRYVHTQREPPDE